MLNIEEKLAAIDVNVTIDPSWVWQMNERLGLTSSDAPQEEKIITTIRFKPERTDLKEIEAKWKQICGNAAKQKIVLP